MHRFWFIALALSLGDTPEDAFAELKKAVQEKNFGVLCDFLSPADLREFEADWKKQKETLASPDSAEALKEFADMLGVKTNEVLKLSARDFVIRKFTHMAEKAPDDYKREFAKVTSGTLVEKKLDGEACLFRMKVEDRVEEVEFVKVDGKWRLSMGPERREANQRSATITLLTLCSAQADFRSNDRDGDGINNFWVKDIAGLHGLETAGQPIRLIMIQTADADRTPGKGKYGAVKGDQPQDGYFFVSPNTCLIKGKPVTYDEGKGRNASRFAGVAYPAQYGRTGTLTYLTNETNTVWSKDTGGKPIEEFPENPLNDGWVKVQ